MTRAPRPTFADEGTDEALDYLDGVLASDPVVRSDNEAAAELNPYNSAAFWRGVIETAGSITLSRYPRVALTGCYNFLRRSLDWCADNITGWDPGDLDFQAGGGSLTITGRKAQDVCRALYTGQSVGLDSIRCTVEEILQWTGKR